MELNLYEKRVAPFYDSWESQNEDFRQETIRRRLKEYIAFAQDSTRFHGMRDYQIDFNSDHPLKKIPPMEASDLRSNVPPGGNDLVAAKDNYYTVFQSGGTTGMPKTALFGHDELEQLNLGNARGFYALGLTPEDRVANLWAVGGLYMTFVHLNRMIQQYGCMNFPFSNQTPVEFVQTVTQAFKINCFTGITSVVLNCLRQMHQKGAKDLQIDKVFYGGEHIYEADKQELREKFGVKTIAAPGYGTVDSWYLGYQCSESSTGVFHVHDDQCFVEVVNEDKPLAGNISLGTPCEIGEIGMLYATPYPRRVTPIVRYRVGDKVRWLPGLCSCGRTTPRFELLGRGDDVLRIGYDSIDYTFIQELIAEIPELSATAQMEKVRDAGRDRLIIRIETEVSKDNYPAITQRLNNLFLEKRPSFSEFIKKKTVWPLQIELLSPGLIPLNSRTGKLIRVKDSI